MSDILYPIYREAEMQAREHNQIRRQLARADRFDNYREITAKFNSTGKCGHAIKKGDRIGWNKSHGCHCADCWARWSAENAEADALERGYMNNCL